MNWLFLIVIIIGLAYAVTGTIIIARERNRSRRINDNRSTLPPVTILKPLKGLDVNLATNLRTFFEQDYPEFEIVFCIRDNDDPAIPVVRQIQREYPLAASRLVINNYDIGYNPKVNNLANGMSHARHDILVVSDSNVRVQPDYLVWIVSELMTPGVELVTSVIRGVGGSGLGSLLENIHLNGFIAGSVYTISRLFKIPVTVGKSMCFRRRLLVQMGGWKFLANYLVEDAMLGREVARRGYEIRQCFHPVENINDGWSLANFVNRRLRWLTMRRCLSLPNYTMEITANPITIASIYFALFPGVDSAIFWLVTASIKTISDLISARLIGDRSSWINYLLIPAKDILIGLIWLAPFFRRTISWRGNRFRLNSNTLIVPVGKSALTSVGRRVISGLSWRTLS